MKKYIQNTGPKKQADVSISISVNLDFKLKLFRRDGKDTTSKENCTKKI